MEGIDDIFWHDSEILSVIELPEKDQLIFNVEYPVDWEKNKFERKSIIFEDFFLYEIKEIPFYGNPTILDVGVIANSDSSMQVEGYFKVKIETNAGDRFVTAGKVALSEQYYGI